jgi:hypothetical protein
MLDAPRRYCIGPWEFSITPSACLLHLRFDSHEVLERIYASVRDENWGSIPAAVGEIAEDLGPDKLLLTLSVVHRQASIAVCWRIAVEAYARLPRFAVKLDGIARSTFKRNRLGLCVHHPLESCLGKPCVVGTVSGERVQSTFPTYVAPWQPFSSIRSLQWEPSPGLKTKLEFSGDVFETEDQRNWTDHNYKTYCTPLSLPFPVEVPAGAEVHHALHIDIGFSGATGQRSISSGWPAQIDSRPLVGVPTNLPAPAVRKCSSTRVRLWPQNKARKRPLLGLQWHHEFDPTPDEIERLRRLRMDHVRIDCRTAPAPTFLAELAGLLETRLELAVWNTAVLQELKAISDDVARWLVFESDAPTSGPEAAQAARKILGPAALLVVGTDGPFAELNRNRPAGDGWDGLCFSACPQVHVDDDEGVMANAEGICWPIRTAQRFSGGKPIIVSPITLRPRNNPAAAHFVPPPPDPRQHERFCAAWTLASLSALLRSGAASATYFASHGPEGVQDRSGTFPVYEVFAAIAEVSSFDWIPCEAERASDVAGLLLKSDARERWIVGNRRPEAIEVEVPRLERSLPLGPYELAVLDVS